METTSISSFLDYYSKVKGRTNRLLSVVRPEHLDFSYKQGKFTIADQIRHIAAIERFMFVETLVGRKSVYQGCGNELVSGYENIMDFFNNSRIESLEIIKSLKDEDLKGMCLTPANTEITRSKWLMMLAEHEIHHRAELYIYLNLLDVKTPPMFRLTSEEVHKLSNKKL
jgi:uncharacterized damage-inducible protein DinB